MPTKFDTVKDSSVWCSPTMLNTISETDTRLFIGQIKNVLSDENTGELRYLVEILNRSDKILINCRMMGQLGGTFNYQDVVMRGYDFSDGASQTKAAKSKAGDIVLVGLLGGQGREGIILGGMQHPARKADLDIKKGPQYKSEFNGIETYINQDGEYSLTFKGQPTNLDKLTEKPDQALPKPEYDTKVGTTALSFDKDGGFKVSDNAEKKPQTLSINKKDGILSFLSGDVSLKMAKDDESIKVVSKTLSLSINDSVTVKTKSTVVDSTQKINLKSNQIAIGTDGIELLNQLSQLIDAIGQLTAISPVGPCTPLLSTPQWAQIVKIQASIKSITGSF
jgi:hypothetical protein